MIIILAAVYFVLASNAIQFKYLEETKTVLLIAMLVSALIVALQHSTLIVAVLAIMFSVYKLYENNKQS